MSSYTSSPRHGNDGDVDENESFDLEDDKDYDTEDASETEAIKPKQDFTPIKEQMYQDKLAQLKKQLQQLKEGLLPEYMKKLKKIEIQYRERLRLNEVWLSYELELVEKDYVKEKKTATKEFEEKKIDLKENLIAELEEKKRMVDCERSTVELTGDSMEMKPIATRKLRRRPNDPIPLPEKRRKPSPAQLNYILDEDDIIEDLKILNKVSGKPFNKRPQPAPAPLHANPQDNLFEARIDDGKLYYEKRWFHRGQSVYVDSKDTGRFPAVISAVGTQEIWLRKTADNSKLRIYCTQLQKGRYSIRKRTS